MTRSAVHHFCVKVGRGVLDEAAEEIGKQFDNEIAYAPKDRPVTTAEIAATVYQGLGIDLATELPGPQSRPLRLVDHGVEPIEELF